MIGLGISKKHSPYPSVAMRRELARKRTLARIRSLREEANRLECLLKAGDR
jgi:hypothetical protein